MDSTTILFSVHLAPLEEENRVMLIVFVIYTDLRFPGLRGETFRCGGGVSFLDAPGGWRSGVEASG